jgi:hypothetical protein
MFNFDTFCHRCLSRDLRPSSLRFGDLPFFLIGFVGTRCRACSKRFYLHRIAIPKGFHRVSSKLKTR